MESEDDAVWRRIVLALAVAMGLAEPETSNHDESSPNEDDADTPTTPETSPVETVAPEPTSSESDTPWGWIALALGLVLAAVIAGVVLWRRKQRGPPGSEAGTSS